VHRLSWRSYSKRLLGSKCSLPFYRKIRIHCVSLMLRICRVQAGRASGTGAATALALSATQQRIRLLQLPAAVPVIHSPVRTTPVLVRLQTCRHRSTVPGAACVMVRPYRNVWLLANACRCCLFVTDYQTSPSQVCCSKLFL